MSELPILPAGMTSEEFYREQVGYWRGIAKDRVELLKELAQLLEKKIDVDAYHDGWEDAKIFYENRNIRAEIIEECALALLEYGLERVDDQKDYPATIIAACLYRIRALKEKT